MNLISFRVGAKFLLFAALWAISSESLSVEYEIGIPPTWVEAGAAPTAAAVPRASDGVRYLSSDDQVNLGGERPVWYRRIVYEVDEARALASAGQFTIGFQPEYQKVRIHSIEVWRKGVRQDRRAQAHIQVLRREEDLEAGLIDGVHTLSVTIPDLQVGDRVEYSFSIVGSNPVFGRAYYDTYSASYSEPLGFKRIKFIYPLDTPLHWRSARPEYRVKEGKVGSDRYVEFVASDLSRVVEEADAPPSFDPYGKIEISTAADWNDIARWAAGIYPGRFSDRSLARDLAKRLKLDPGDGMGSMRRAIEYVQGEIRYTGLEMGENSHAPHAPETTVARRFGDCKDKSVLLVALLHEAGIEARPVLVHSTNGPVLAERLPSALAFDHVVVRARVGGEAYWIDPTREAERGDLAARDPLPFRLGLPVDAVARRLVDIPYPAPAVPQVDVGQHVRVREKDGKYRADFVVVTDYRGLKAQSTRTEFQSNDTEAIGKSYLEYMRNFYDSIDLAANPRIGIDSDESARTFERYRMEWDAAEADIFGVVLFQLADWMPVLKLDSRKSPLALGGPRLARQVVRTDVGLGWSVRDEKETISNPFFVFTRTVKVDGNTLVIVGEWRRFADQVPAKDYPRLKKDLARARDLLEFNVDLNAGYGRILDTGIRAWLWPLSAIAVLAASLFALWLLRKRIALAGMLYRPRSTVPPLLRPDRILPGTLGLLFATMLIDVAVDRGAEYAHLPTAMHLGMMVGAAIGFFLRFFLYSALVRWAFKLLSKAMPYRSAVAATAWGGFPPMILFLLCAWIAVGFDIRLFAETYEADTEQLPGVLIAGVMAAAGIAWGLIGLVNSYSAAAASTRRCAFAAICLTFVIALFILGPLALLAMAVK